MEHDEQAERLEREAEDMEKRSEDLGDRIEGTRRDWEAKEDDPSVPGARPELEESGQLPEEGPPEQVPDDTSQAARPEAEDSPGGADDEGTATGNPNAAGADE